VLVGHSYCSMVITEAGEHDVVRHLIYVSIYVSAMLSSNLLSKLTTLIDVLREVVESEVDTSMQPPRPYPAAHLH
jgi:hypothetical protein